MLLVYSGFCPQIAGIGQSSAIFVRDPIVRLGLRDYCTFQVPSSDFGGFRPSRDVIPVPGQGEERSLRSDRDLFEEQM